MKRKMLLLTAFVAAFTFVVSAHVAPPTDVIGDGDGGVDKWMNKVCEKTNSDGTPAAGCEAPDANGPCCTKVDCPR